MSYVFHGHFAPTDRPPTSTAVAATPSELIGQQYTIEISWPTSASEYSADWQTGTDEMGSYSTEAITVSIDVPGFDFSAPPVIYRWETYNDAVLEYLEGVPQRLGDELRLRGKVERTNTYFDTMTSGSWTSVTGYILLLHAADDTGSAFDDDSLHAEFDLTTFPNVWFEFRQIVPVASSDPLPIRYEHWFGVVDSLAVVPEPDSFWLATLGAIVAVTYWARRRFYSTQGSRL